MHHVGRILLAMALLGTVGSTLGVYPHQLAYFNELAGGPYKGWRHLLGSSLDWGQDGLLLLDWLAVHSEAAPARFHGTSPFNLGNLRVDRHAETAGRWPRADSGEGFTEVVVLSVNQLQRRGVLGAVQGCVPFNDDAIMRLTARGTPVDTVGPTMVVYAIKRQVGYSSVATD